MATSSTTAIKPDPSEITYHPYDRNQEPTQLENIRRLISKDLSEPYSIYVYRYFLYQWGELCYLAMHKDRFVGVVVSKLENHRGGPLRGYIAMLAVEEEYRGMGIAKKLVRMAIDAMIERNADEVALETEITNHAAIRLYEGLGFLRSKRLHRYYLNGSSAFRLVLFLKSHKNQHLHQTCGEGCGHENSQEHKHQQNPLIPEFATSNARI